jgi:hypothetical protein
VNPFRDKRRQSTSPIQPASGRCAACDALGLALCNALVKLSARDREIIVLRTELQKLIPLTERLGDVAGALPGAVEFAAQRSDEANDLRVDRDRAEIEAALLAAVAMRPEIDALERDGDNGGRQTT